MKREEMAVETPVYLLFKHLSRLAARERYTEVEIAVREWLQQRESNFNNPDGIL
jgi:hypothetical protein